MPISLPDSPTSAAIAAFCRLAFLHIRKLAVLTRSSLPASTTPISCSATTSALETSGGDFGFAIALDLAMLGRTDEAFGVLRQKEPLPPWRLGKLYLTSLRALLEGDRAQSLKESDELAAAT